MKIIFFSSWGTRCGIADYSCNLMEGLRRSGVEVSVVPLDDARSSSDFARLGKEMNGGDIAHIQHEYGFFGEGLAGWARNFRSFIRQIRVPWVVTLHELMAPSADKPLYGLRRAVISSVHRRLLSRAALVIVHLRKQRETLISIGIPPSKVAVMQLPVPELKSSAMSPEDCKALLGLEGKKIVTIFGYVVDRKGYDVALRAMSDTGDITLLIAGGPPQGDKSGYFESLSALTGLQDRVKITGYIEDSQIDTIMGATDLVLAPFKEASGSSSLSLALAYHKPILASDIEAIREIREDGLEMGSFKSGDSRDLAQKAREILEDPVLMDRLANSSRLYAERFGYSSSAKTAAGLYADILGSGGQQ